MTIFSMIVVDTCLVYSQVTGSTELQSEFYVHLAEELIDNNIDSRLQHQRNSGEDGSDSNDESCWKPSSLLSNVHFRNTTKKLQYKFFALNFVYLYF